MKNKSLANVVRTQIFSSIIPSNLNSISRQLQIKKAGLLFLVAFIFCAKGIAQVSENFDSGIPAEWTVVDNGVGSEAWQTTTDGYLGTNAVSINPSLDNIGDQNTAQYFLVTPQFAVPENGEIHFFTKQGSEVDKGTQYQIRLSTAAQPDFNGFNINLQSYTESNLNTGSQTSYEEKIVEIPSSIPAGLNIYIAFVAVNTQNGVTPAGDEWFIDNVSILEGCSEVDTDDVTIDNITVDGAEVTWSHPSATNFELQVLPIGGIPSGAGIPVTGTSYTLQNLDEQTEYDIYIRAICNNNTVSEYSGPFTFETLKFGLSCDEPIVIPDISTTPYVLIDNLDQWENPDITYTTEGTNCLPGSNTTNYLNGNKIFLSYTPTEDGLLTLTQETGTDGGANGNNCYNSRSSLFVYDSCADVGVNCLAGTITTASNQPMTISNLLVQAGETYIIVVSSQLSTTAGICFQLEISSPNCAPPGDIYYNDLTEDSVSFNWDNIGGFSDSWEYAVVTAGSGEPTGSGTATATNLDNVISGLAPDTVYDIYVRSVCGGTPGVWSDAVTFKTQCSTFNTPYSTEFTNATNENPEPCWTTLDVDGDGNSFAFIGGYATLRTENNNINGLNNDIYASPRVNFDGITQKRLRYKHRATQGVSTYSVKLSTTGVGRDNFTTIIQPETTINNTTFQEVIVDIPIAISGEVNVAFVIEPNTTETALRISFDDVVIEDKPTCPDPLDPFVLESQITTNSAWLLWTAGDSETQWQVAIQDEGSGIPTTDGELVSNNFPYVANGLDSGRRYEFYVRAYCAADDQSEWVGPVAFTTLCESYDTPFYESFDDEDAGTQKFCWEINDANGDSATWTIDEDHALIQTSPFSPPSGFNDYLISPAINMDGIKELKYKYRADFSFQTGPPRFGLEVLMSTTNTNPSSFSVISPFEVFTNSNYEEKSIIIEATGTVYIAFRVPPEFTGGWSILSLDDVSITDAPSCPNPSGLTVDTVFSNSAELSWTQGYQETDWNVAVQLAGSGIPTTGEAVTDPNFIPSGLTADTEYEFYVQANCGTETSDWIGPITFSTLCNAFASPFTETFNTDSETESCWTVVNSNDDLETWELNTTGFSYEGDQAAVMFTGQNGNNDDWLISPTITITENQRLRYYYRVNDSFFTEDLDVLLSTNGIGLDQFTTVLYDSDTDTEIINNVEYKVKIINFPAGISGDINIAFHVPYFPSTGPYRGQTLAIDNVNIEDVPECAEVTNISIGSITDTEFLVSWDANGSETDWEISVQPSGTSAPVGDTDPTYLYNADSNPFTVTGLDPSTMYDVYVRPVCTGVTDAEWVGPETLTTRCSFDNLCQYTFVLTSGSDVSATLDISQNNQFLQSLPFEGNTGDTFTVFLCSGTEFSVYFDTIGSNQAQYDSYQFDILDASNNVVFSSPTGILLRTTVYEGTAICGAISCPQPTNLTINEFSEFSWTPAGSETQWEVAVQPYQNGTIPQSGTLVSTNSYTPIASDFVDPNVATYEYFVRAVCGTDDESYWSGPFEFVRNDDISNAITVPINDSTVCETSVSEVSFINASVSPESMTCSGTNGSDVWFDFIAESQIHIIELNSFSGSLRDTNGDPAYYEMITTLYRDNAGTLEEIACSYDNVLVAMYSSELVVGDNYKVRVTLNSTDTTEHRFSICIKTPEDLCLVDTPNGDFEEPVIYGLSGVNTIISLNTVPGWRSNLDSSNNIFYWESLNAPGFTPYEGGQCVQILSDQGTTIDPNDPNIKGLYRDFDTSEMTLMDYSFAHLARFDGNTVELFAGVPGGPYTQIDSHLGATQAWSLVTGQYIVPAGQTETRFIFRASDGDDIGNVLDAVNFVANNEIITQPHAVDCNSNTTTVEANGMGTWIASDSNPGEVTIVTPSNNTTDINSFVQPGIYTFTWQTSYCSYDIEITYNGVAEVPTVESSVEYCLNDTSEQLIATPADALTLVWYTVATGGTGSTTAPTPDTSVVATTSYYVAYMNNEGCEGPRAEIIVTVSESFTPQLVFSYDDTCILNDVDATPILSNDFNTGGTFTSTTLTVDPSTGVIDMSSALAGQHDILYTFEGDEDNCLEGGTYTATINFIAAQTPVTTFNYGNEAFCLLNGTTVLPTLDSGFTTGGTFSSTTVTVDSTTGEIDLTTAPEGIHDVTYTFDENIANCIEGSTYTTTIEVVATVNPVTDFSYAESNYCEDTGIISVITGDDFTSGGTFSSTAGLTLDAITGDIDLDASATGTYTITYEIAEDLNNCIANNSSNFTLTINASVASITEFSYNPSVICPLGVSELNPELATGFTTGGNFSSATLDVDIATGIINMTSATSGTHEITYTYEEDTTNCILEGSFTTTIEITETNTPVTTFSYNEDVYCGDAGTIFPNTDTDFTQGGTFTAENGLVINSSTGEIDVAASTLGNYTVTYTIPSDQNSCTENGSSSFNITILDTIEVAISGECDGEDYILTASPVASSFNPDEATYLWTDANGNVTNQTSEIFNITDYLDQNSGLSVPTIFNVTVQFGGCSVTQSFTAERSACRDIPKGISPDGNGKNDTFDLTGFGVTEIYMYNRYGTEVYTFKGTYTNQWYGQSNKGDELPDGTYFYSIRKEDGSSVTGWVYINRAY
ncbi:choice-of-anchor J domain-containing protein [Winogradskyella marincola]|uniref:Choice-of-anchor J domain-containing protein n=1 Tax=Winogradskyella marincola TaxID=3037795 RepID=A0ABT6G4S4_9FLAO|nr:choice-of-anchor J domain-containing protein [Winogradskyella sp. YYF002]MDG4717035.1 choice-of-anchor J domain-containing protein [Winogradskyella sp. YYF002]